MIGGGFTGVNTAIELAQRGLSVVLIEARRIGWGASGRNGGQLIRGIGHEVEGFAKYVGQEGVRYLQRAGIDSVELVRQRIADNGIECDLRWGFCELANTPGAIRSVQGRASRSGRTRLCPRNPPGRPRADPSAGGQLPMCMPVVWSTWARVTCTRWIWCRAKRGWRRRSACGSSSRARCWKSSTAKPCRCAAPAARVRAGSLVLGCNAHLDELEQQLSGKVLPAGSYIIATEPLSEARAAQLIPHNLALCDQKVGLDYYRLSADRRLLFGGACHYSGRDPADIAAYMRPKMLKVFPQLADVRIDYQWGGKIGITANRFPQVGRLKQHPNVFYAQGYSGHGLNVTHWCAKLLGEAIHAGHSQGMDVFSGVPHMTFPGGPALRSPLLALGMFWYRLREILG